MNERKVEVITIRIASRRCGVSPTTIRRYIRRGLVQEPLTAYDMLTLRRIRRLTSLGINLAGVEAILHMRARIKRLRAQVEQIESS
jgi:DNA-binding transcriptional MerR regulator